VSATAYGLRFSANLSTVFTDVLLIQRFGRARAPWAG
jgi:hydroxypyruvate isomerase